MADKGRRSYIAIDLKSFYASVECKERELDPMTTNLVVADKSRTEKTICLAVSPSLKSYGIPGRARLFEVMQKVKEVNKRRICMAPGKKFAGASVDNEEIKLHPELELDYITAVPRMALYMKCSTEIYNIYLKYVAPEDIHVYSIDEVFMDVTDYLNTYRMTARELAGKIIREIQQETSIAATAGIGTNLYLCKVAMDIVAKHIEPDQNGVRIAELTEISYRKLLWAHQPITDFWRVGPGYAKKLAEVGLFTMGDVARCSLGKPGEYYNEDICHLHYQKAKTKEEKRYYIRGLRRLLDWISGYGTKPCRTFLTIILLILIFGTAYYVIPCLQYQGVSGWLECIYASAITFFAVGYGDLFPATLATKMVSLVEAFSGVTMTSYFLVILSRKVIR